MRQYRHPVGYALWELPAGLVDVSGEDLVTSAARELAEEADLAADRFDLLAELRTSPGCSNEKIRLFLARDLHPVPHDQLLVRRPGQPRQVVPALPALGGEHLHPQPRPAGSPPVAVAPAGLVVEVTPAGAPPGIAERLGVPKVLLTTSCTHALEMSGLLLDIEPGDEVIIPSFTFVSTVNAYALRGARPVFVDIRPDGKVIIGVASERPFLRRRSRLEFSTSLKAFRDGTRRPVAASICSASSALGSLRSIQIAWLGTAPPLAAPNKRLTKRVSKILRTRNCRRPNSSGSFNCCNGSIARNSSRHRTKARLNRRSIRLNSHIECR